MGRTPSQYAAKAAGFPGLLWLTATGGLVGLCVRSGLTEATGAMALPGAGPVLAILGFFPLLLLIRFCRPIAACLGAAAWGSGVALFSAGFDPAMWLAYIAGPALFALLASLLTRRIGFSALVIAVLWMLTELAMMTSGLAPCGLLASLAEGSAVFSGIAAWLGSVHVALLLALLAAGVMEAIQNVSRRRRLERLKRAAHAISMSRDWRDLFVRSLHCPETSRPRGPPVVRTA